MTLIPRRFVFSRTGTMVALAVLACWFGMTPPEDSTREMPRKTAGTLVMNPHHSEIMMADIFRVIRQVESGGHPDPYNAEGADGELGPFQITEAYFKDAVEQDPSLYGLEFEGVRDDGVAQKIMIAFWERYATVPWDAEQLCRLHNGGPSMRGTDDNWEKCKVLFR